MEEKIRQGTLFDFYGVLLKDQQKSIVESYVCEDLSLGEIAEQTGLSRQGVHDTVRRATRRMEEYEEKLQLIAKFSSMRTKLEKICEYTKSDNIRELAESLLEEI